MYSHIHAVKNTTICQIVSLCNKQHYVIYNNYMFRPCKWAIIRLFLEPVSWLYNRSFYKAETCSCILRSVAYYIVILSDKLLCFWLHVYVNTHIIIYIVLLRIRCYFSKPKGVCEQKKFGKNWSVAHRERNTFNLCITLIFIVTRC